MADPISLTVAVAGVAVGGATLALQGASSAYHAYDIKRNKKNKKQEAAPAVGYPSQPIAPSQTSVNPYTYAGGPVNALPNGLLTSGLNTDNSPGWATITTTETICMENGRPVAKESKIVLLQSSQYPQTQAAALPTNMLQTTQIPYAVASESKPPMINSTALDSKAPMLPMHCSIAQGMPAHDQGHWQQTAPPPPYQEYPSFQEQTKAQIRKRDRWIHFK